MKVKSLLLGSLIFVTTLYAETVYTGVELVEKLKGKTMKNYPTSTVRGYVNNRGKLFLKVGVKGNNQKYYKGTLLENGSVKWKKGKEGKSSLSLVKGWGNSWVLKDDQGLETPKFNIESGNYFKF